MNIEKVEKRMKGGKRVSDDVIVAIIDGRERHVPEDPDNADYAEIKKMEREGKIVIAEKNID